MADLTITAVTLTQGGAAVANIAHATTFSVDVAATAAAEDFDEGVVYKLFVFVTSLNSAGLLVPPILTAGTLQDANWPASANLFQVPVPAGTLSPDIYSITVALLEGPTGAGGISFASAGPLFVH
ncbi:MAG TPA: hypothetical protein VGF67_11680 [Ktedonobacteraceae bacterium]|jgi:hypothetical protein